MIEKKKLTLYFSCLVLLSFFKLTLLIIGFPLSFFQVIVLVFVKLKSSLLLNFPILIEIFMYVCFFLFVNQLKNRFGISVFKKRISFYQVIVIPIIFFNHI